MAGSSSNPPSLHPLTLGIGPTKLVATHSVFTRRVGEVSTGCSSAAPRSCTHVLELLLGHWRTPGNPQRSPSSFPGLLTPLPSEWPATPNAARIPTNRHHAPALLQIPCVRDLVAPRAIKTPNLPGLLVDLQARTNIHTPYFPQHLHRRSNSTTRPCTATRLSVPDND